MAEVPGGTVLRGDDGSLYFIRDEVLAACKVEGEHKDKLEEALASEGDVEGFAFTLSNTRLQTSQINSPALGTLKGSSLDLGGLDAKINSMSTVMCPW